MQPSRKPPLPQTLSPPPLPHTAPPNNHSHRSKRQKTSTGSPSLSSPLFSPSVLRATFNPLPAIDPLFSPPSATQHGHALPPFTTARTSHPLNQLSFPPPDWLSSVVASSPNTLPRPDRLLLIFGSGDMGQMGLGPEKLDDIKKPVVHGLIQNLKQQAHLPLGPESVACGGMHSLLVDGQGQVWSWGINDNAALGRVTEGIEGTDQEDLESRPLRVQGLPEPDTRLFRAVRVAAGDSVSVALSNEGELRAWGSFRSNDGLLGFVARPGSIPKQLVPTRVSNLSQFPVCQVVCGYDHVLALTTLGHVYSWGNGQQLQLGRKVIERRKQNGLAPERLALKRIVLIGSGGSHCFAVSDKADVYGWGLNTRGQLGLSQSSQTEIIPRPTLIPEMSPSFHQGARVVAIEGGDFHTIFLLNNGQVWSVGNYENGEIGLGKDHPEVVKVEKERTEGLKRKASFVESGMKKRRHKFETELEKFQDKVKREGDWSAEEIESARPRWEEMMALMDVEQEAARMGFVPAQCIRTPAQIIFPRPIVDISSQARHSLAVDVDGNAYSWGLGQSSELGLGQDEDGEDIEMVLVPRKLGGKALLGGLNNASPIKVIKCQAGGTHSALIGITVPPPKTNGTSG